MIESMKQALDALEYVKKTYDEQCLVSLGTNTAIIDLRQAIAEAKKQEPVAWSDLLKEADQIVRNKVLWKRFIDGTPLANDIACWMADFAQQHAHPQPKAEQEPVIDKSAAVRIATALGWEPKRERNFCERCGKRLFDGIHTCTPPAEQLKREWVGLRWSDTPDKWVGNVAFMEGAKWAERILKEKNT